MVRHAIPRIFTEKQNMSQKLYRDSRFLIKQCRRRFQSGYHSYEQYILIAYSFGGETYLADYDLMVSK